MNAKQSKWASEMMLNVRLSCCIAGGRVCMAAFVQMQQGLHRQTGQKDSLISVQRLFIGLKLQAWTVLWPVCSI
jgi:hypothetical protein